MQVAVSERGGHFGPKFQVEWDVPTTICGRLDRQIGLTTMPTNVFTQRNFVAGFLREKPIFIRKTVNFRFMRLPLGVMGNVRGSSYRLIGKLVFDFLLVIFELF